MKTLYGDTETFSEVDLRVHGTHRYADAVEIMLFGWAIDDGNPQMWDVTAQPLMPPALYDALLDPECELVFQNSHFDRTCIRGAFGIDLPIERFHDTMVQAMAHALPGGLAKLGYVIGMADDERKLEGGKDLIQLFCKPRPKNHNLRRATSATHPDKWQEFIDYCLRDVDTMRRVKKTLPNWNYKPSSVERNLWFLDQKINDRGFAVDVDLAQAAIRATDQAKAALRERIQHETAGAVSSATKRDALLAYILAEHGVDLPDLTSDTLKRRLEDPELPDAVRQLVAIRLEAGMASSAKYKALVNAVSPDGRLRNALQFAGAIRTQRWAGRIFQPQNMKRPDKDLKDEATLNALIDAIKADCLEVVHDEPMRCLANVVRGCIVAPPGKKLVQADLSNIEGRMLVWLAGEEWKLRAFAEFDAGRGDDMYKVAYARSFNTTPDRVDDYQRQIGKVQELAMGYEGGVGAFITFSIVYKMDLDELAEAVWLTADQADINQARRMLEWTKKKRRTTYGLEDHVWIACELLKAKWRDAHPEVVKLWKRLASTVVNAIANPGIAYPAGSHLKVQRDGAWLRIRLPSGRYLCYLHPRVDDGVISYMGINQYTRQWNRIKTYGGKLTENVDQAESRDVLSWSMPVIENEIGHWTADPNDGIILTFHDEILTQVPDDHMFGSDDLVRLMTRVPPWAQGLPLAAKGFETYRYRKD